MTDKTNSLDTHSRLFKNMNSDWPNKPYYKPYINTEIRGESVQSTVDDLTALCHGLSIEAGWHPNENQIGTDLMLIVSEVGEAMEGARKDIQDDKLPHRKMLDVELADALIRILDTAGKYNIPLGEIVVEKLRFNTRREDHDPKVRASKHGKKF